MGRTMRFDAVDYLDTEERQVAYIEAALESGDTDFARDALGLVARARGMAGIAKDKDFMAEQILDTLNLPGHPTRSIALKIWFASTAIAL